METAGKTLDEKELSDAMKETGLGTPATRAAIIEVLLKRGYIVRDGKSLEATDKGIRLIEVVHPEVKSPAMTGQWEAYLQRIQRGTAQLAPFLKGIEDYVREVVGKVGRRLRRQGRAGASACQPESSPVHASAANRRDLGYPLRRIRLAQRLARVAPARRTQPLSAPPYCAPRRNRVAPRLRNPVYNGGTSTISCKAPSASPPSAPTRKPSARPSSKAATCCWSCPPAPASRSATSCPASRAAAPRW